MNIHRQVFDNPRYAVIRTAFSPVMVQTGGLVLSAEKRQCLVPTDERAPAADHCEPRCTNVPLHRSVASGELLQTESRNAKWIDIVADAGIWSHAT